MAEELEILIRWEIGTLQDQLEELKKELRTLMIDRNTAALRVVAMDNAGLPYPSSQDDLASLDIRVEKLTSEIQSIQQQLSAWRNLLTDIDRPDIAMQIKPMIRTVELQRSQENRFQ
jgi:hypothetical protein